MTNQSTKTFTVLVGIDYSDLSELALTEAVAVASSREGAHLHAVHAIHTLQTAGPSVGAPFVPVLDDVGEARASEVLRDYVEKVLAEPHESQFGSGGSRLDRVTTHIRIADPVHAVAQLSSDIEANLVVVGTHGRRGLGRLFLGSVAEGVVRLAPCPVLVVRPRGTETANVPKIEPPCPRCLETRRAADGKEFWCAQHREHHEPAHTYHFRPVRSGHQSGLLFPMSGS